MYWAAATLLLAAALLKLRHFVQGYWYDRSFSWGGRVLRDRVAVVTGGNSGLGLAAALQLARYGCKVIVASRSERRANEAIQKAKSAGAAVDGMPLDITFMHLDLNSPSSIASFAAHLQREHKALHYLINNAGVSSHHVDVQDKPTVATNGVEMVFQVDYLGHYEMTNLLLPQLREAGRSMQARIVAVSSGVHAKATIGVDGSTAWDADSLMRNTNRYGQAKLAQIMHVQSLQRSFDADGAEGGAASIKAVAVTPGFIPGTGFFKGLFPEAGAKYVLFTLLAWPLVWLLGRSNERGAQVIVMAALDQKVEGGSYWSNCLQKQPTGKDGIANDATAQRRLEILSDTLVSDGAMDDALQKNFNFV